MIYKNYILKFLNNDRQRVWNLIINTDHFPQYHLKTQTQKPKKKKGGEPRVCTHIIHNNVKDHNKNTSTYVGI